MVPDIRVQQGREFLEFGTLYGDSNLRQYLTRECAGTENWPPYPLESLRGLHMQFHENNRGRAKDHTLPKFKTQFHACSIAVRYALFYYRPAAEFIAQTYLTA
jgi:hypothetical protein